MGPITRLCTPEFCIEVDTTNKGWWRCSLASGESCQYLGAETPEYLTNHLLTVLNLRWEDLGETIAGDIDGYAVKWVLSLSEDHSSLYVAPDGDCKLLFWQDAHARPICVMRLSPELVAQWHNQLQLLPTSL